MEFEVSHDFPERPETVFAALTDLDRAREWVPGLVELERLDDGPLGPQSRWRETRTFMGKEATEEFEVTSYGPPAVLEFRTRGDGSHGGEYVFRYRLVPQESGTRVQLRGEVRGLKGITRWLSQLFARKYRDARQSDLEALGRYMKERSGKRS